MIPALEELTREGLPGNVVVNIGEVHLGDKYSASASGHGNVTSNQGSGNQTVSGAGGDGTSWKKVIIAIAGAVVAVGGALTAYFKYTK